MTLNEYARDNDPFAKVGRETVAVEVTSVVRASDTSFQVRWLERTFEGGAAQGHQAPHRPLLDRHHAAAHRRGRAQEPARHLRARLQLVAGPQRRREPNEHAPAGSHAARRRLVARRLRHPRRRCRRSRSSTAPPSRRPSASRSRSRRSNTSRCRSRCRCPDSSSPCRRRRENDKGRHARRKERVAGANAAARIEPAKDGYINAIQVYPYTKGALYQLYAAVNQVTDIALEAGEKLVSVSAGDTVRWVVGDTTSGEGKDAQVHILVKPIGADLETNLVITTDRRTYHLELRVHRQDLHGVGVVDLSGRPS